MSGNFHFPKATVEAKVWCKKCGKPTMHRIMGGLVSSCKECATAPPAKPAKKPAPVQEELFR